MLLEVVKLGDLTAYEIWPQQVARVLPGWTIAGEDALAEQRVEGSDSPVWQLEILELRRQNGFDILRLDGIRQVCKEGLQVICVSIPHEPPVHQFE